MLSSQMREALDGFEVEGIGHNLPFLSAVMDHARFVKGDITTAFIEEEYLEGFVGVDLEEDELMRIAASCAAMNRVAEIRRTKRYLDEWIIMSGELVIIGLLRFKIKNMN